MKKHISSMAALLVIAFLLGAVIGLSSPAEVQAGPGPPCSLDQCFEFTGPIGSGGCSAPCYAPYKLWSGENYLGCCGTLLQSGCWCVCC